MKKFEFKVKLGGHSTAMCFMRPPFDVVEVFGTKARVPVRGMINGFPFRSSLSNMGQGHCMPVNKTLREGGKCKAGDVVEIVMERDDEKRVVAAPPLLKKELAKSKTAQANWEKMSFTNKKEIARSIAEPSRKKRERDAWRR
jgi:hypothetical protein